MRTEDLILVSVDDHVVEPPTLFDNHLPEPTGIHWHGLELPIEMDGVPGVVCGVPGHGPMPLGSDPQSQRPDPSPGDLVHREIDGGR